MANSDPSSSQYSPVDPRSGTPTNLSHSFPRSSFVFPNFPLTTRQLRPPKSPMYVPAVLRPTERPHRPSPLTPPRSVHGSTDSLDGQGRRPISRRSTNDSTLGGELGRVSEDTLNQELGKVQGLPTREHWKLDSYAVICDAPTCQKTFSLFERRHHCRHCGHVFCNTDSHYAIPLDHNAEFHPDGAMSRACKHCWDRYCAWNSARLSSAGIITEESSTPSTPIEGGGRSGLGGDHSDGQRGSVSTSAPRDWNWSTF